MTARGLRSGLRWLRDKQLVHIVVEESCPALQLTGPEAQIWEAWVDGIEPAAIITEVSLCWRLQPDEVGRRFTALVARLEAAGAVVSHESGDQEEQQWPICS